MTRPNRLLRPLLWAVPLALTGWIAVLAMVLWLGGQAPAVFVPFPPKGLIAALTDVAVTGSSAMSLTLQSTTPDLTGRLYAAGAWLVLPAGLEACIPGFLRDDPPRRQ